METKPFYASKTLWFNALTILVAVATSYGYVPDQSLADHAAGALLFIAPAVNIVLRLVTSRGIGR